MAVTVRRAHSDSDFHRLHRLFVAYEAGLPPPLRHGSVPDMHAIRQTFSQPNAAFIATHDEVAIGCAAVKRAGDDRATTAVLLRLYVRPESRRLGAARLLVTSAIAFARDAGFCRLVLDTEKTELEAAYRLYRSLGFEECTPFATVSYDSPTFMELVLREGP
ncbi:MAG TPA: GNAT family N-acetyltransferase [Candidatus Cybelea sp.]|nr:GNAT family N-acetyltransferase [Candidatus Cybelea sp.]